jgi:hypothetical protein
MDCVKKYCYCIISIPVSAEIEKQLKLRQLRVKKGELEDQIISLVYKYGFDMYVDDAWAMDRESFSTFFTSPMTVEGVDVSSSIRVELEAVNSQIQSSESI